MRFARQPAWIKSKQRVQRMHTIANPAWSWTMITCSRRRSHDRNSKEFWYPKVFCGEKGSVECAISSWTFKRDFIPGTSASPKCNNPSNRLYVIITKHRGGRGRQAPSPPCSCQCSVFHVKVKELPWITRGYSSCLPESMTHLRFYKAKKRGILFAFITSDFIWPLWYREHCTPRFHDFWRLVNCIPLSIHSWFQLPC